MAIKLEFGSKWFYIFGAVAAICFGSFFYI